MSQTAKLVRRSPEVASIRIELIMRGLSVRQFASICGVSGTGMAAEMSRGVTAAPMRCRIERSLGKVYWSSQAEFDRRTRIFDLLGVDPGFDSLIKLLAAAQRGGIDVSGVRKLKAKLICRIEEFIGAHPRCFNHTIPPPKKLP